MILKPPKGTLIQRGHPFVRGLVGCWLMNEGGGNIVNDLSGNGKNITLYNMTPPSGGWTSCKDGPCVKFDYSNDYGITEAPFPAFGLGDFTICVRFMAYGSHNTNNTIISQGTYDDGWLVYNTSTNWRFYIEGLTAEITSPGSEYSRHTTFTIMRKNDVLYWYADSILQPWRSGQDDISGASLNMDATYGVRVGARGTGSPERYFDGEISFAYFWHRGLTDSEIAYLCRNPFCMFGEEM